VEDVARKLEEMAKAEPKLKGLVLDLRNDPGGLLDAAVAISAMFLPEGVTVVSTNGQLEESKFVYKAAPQYYQRRGGPDHVKQLTQATGSKYKSLPLVVLVNEGSASASEIVAGALQDHQRATIMGSQTFGKGSVQTVRPLGPDTGIKLTTARYYTPKGETIQAKGILPDVMVDETKDGNLFAALRTREADLSKHLTNANGDDKAATEAERAAEKVAEQQREKEREQARLRLEEENRKNPGGRILPEFGSAEDFPLQQALAQLKGLPVQVSKTLTARKEEKKEN
jgi:carboxyl-terminal processing protease